MQTSTASTSKLIPVRDLRCYACSPNPTFSNTSHLLTHLASKVHLRTLFELELCATQCEDEECANALERFRKWYAEEKIGEHLVDRFIIKRGKWSREKMKVENQENVQENTLLSLNPKVETGLEEPANVYLEIPKPQSKRKRLNPDIPNQSANHSGLSAEAPRQYNGCLERDSVKGEKTGDNIIEGQFSQLQYSPRGFQITEYHQSDAGIDVTQNPESDERDIIDGPDQGVVVSATRGPRLRGKIWPGMGVFDTAINFNPRRGNHSSTTSGTSRILQSFVPDVKREASPSISIESNEEFSCPSSQCVLSPGDIDGRLSTSGKAEELTSELSLEATLNVNANADLNVIDSDVDADGDIEDELAFAIRTELPKAFANDNSQCTFPHRTSDGRIILPPLQPSQQHNVCYTSHHSSYLTPTSPVGKNPPFPPTTTLDNRSNFQNGCLPDLHRDAELIDSNLLSSLHLGKSSTPAQHQSTHQKCIDFHRSNERSTFGNDESLGSNANGSETANGFYDVIHETCLRNLDTLNQGFYAESR
ncbi:hypothetical protein BDZ91DRAFT_834507 [Kalaharituber pfeilii]|nr:hypothetical protein BDZ91DRAFT_834507 [Kalaharituber pfeilii]